MEENKKKKKNLPEQHLGPEPPVDWLFGGHSCGDLFFECLRCFDAKT